jgi:hypothetical protein
MLKTKPLLASLPSLTTLPSSAKMLPSSAMLPSWANCHLGQTCLPRQSCCPRQILLLAKMLCKLVFLGKVANGIITSIPLALIQALRCPHCGRRPGIARALLLSGCWRHCGHCSGAITIVSAMALASLRCWHHCGRCPGGLAAPLYGRQRPPLGPWPFCRLPSTSSTHPGLRPFVVRLF